VPTTTQKTSQLKLCIPPGTRQDLLVVVVDTTFQTTSKWKFCTPPLGGSCPLHNTARQNGNSPRKQELRGLAHCTNGECAQLGFVSAMRTTVKEETPQWNLCTPQERRGSSGDRTNHNTKDFSPSRWKLYTPHYRWHLSSRSSPCILSVTSSLPWRAYLPIDPLQDCGVYNNNREFFCFTVCTTCVLCIVVCTIALGVRNCNADLFSLVERTTSALEVFFSVSSTTTTETSSIL
jgi:hypothetical protein